MKIILPVAGKGTRLRPHTYARTKSLVKVADKKLLNHVIDSFRNIDLKQIIFITDKENDEQIKKFMKNNYPNYDTKYVIQKKKLGPAHAVWLAKPFIEDDDDILIIYNDTIAMTDLTEIYNEYKDCDGLIYSFPAEDTKRFGIITLDGNNHIIDMIEKPDHDIGSNLAIVGMYYIRKGLELMNMIEHTINNNIKEKGEFFLTLPLKMMIQKGMKFKAPQLDDWLDCGKKETLLESNRKLLGLIKYKVDYVSKYPGCVVIPPVNIHESANIINSIIGPNVSIGQGAVIENCVVKDSIINQEAEVKDVKLKDSLIGECARVVGGVKDFSSDVDPKTVKDHNVINIGDCSEIELAK